MNSETVSGEYCSHCDQLISARNMSRHYRSRHPEIQYPLKEKDRCPYCKCFMLDVCFNCGGLSQEDRFWLNVDVGPSNQCWPWTGCTYTQTGYGQLSFHGRKRGAHTVAYELSWRDFDPAKEVDHECHNPICCNPSHLRMATHKQNLENRSGPNSNNRSSGVRGVKPSGKRWIATIKHNYKAIHIGTFDTKDEAEEAVKAKRRELFTHA